MSEDETYFQEAIARHVETYRVYFGSRLSAVYIWGSVYRGEAVRGVSDLDLHAFIKDSRISADEMWFDQTRKTLDAIYPGLSGLTRPFSERVLLDGAAPDADDQAKAIARALSFRLHYDSTRVWGKELVPLDLVPVPNVHFARGPFEAVRDLARFAAGADPENKTDFALPSDIDLRLRKLARLAVLGGSYLLMSQGQFYSFRGAEVLPLLQGMLPAWADFLTETERLYIVPATNATNTIQTYQSHLVDWVEYVNEQLNPE